MLLIHGFSAEPKIIKHPGSISIMKRFWEVDFFRGIAVILMIIFNYAFALRYFNIYSIGGDWAFWWLFPRFIASIFIFLAGISLALSYNRAKKSDVFRKFMLRGLRISGYGLIITLVTWTLFPREFIVFGILHFIGMSIILSLPFLNISRNKTIIFALLFIASGILLQSFVFDFSWLLWLGFSPLNFHTFDYFPLLPWFGVILLGLFSGNLLYPKGKRAFRMKEISSRNPLCFLGRHSLVIYLLHQVVLVAVLYAFVL